MISRVLGTYPITTSELEETNLEGLDHVRREVVAKSATAMRVGEPLDGYPGHIITALGRRLNGPTHLFTVATEGIASGKGTTMINGYPQEKEDLEGWDTASVAVETSNPNYWTKGQMLPGYTAMVVVQVDRTPINRQRTRWRVVAHGKGIIRSISAWRESESTNMRSFQHDSIQIPLSGGWSDFRKADVAWPQVVKTVSYISAQRPNYGILNGTQTPINPPAVWDPALSGPVEQFTWQWPNGWVAMGMSFEPLPGTTIGFVQIHYEYRPRVRFS